MLGTVAKVLGYRSYCLVMIIIYQKLQISSIRIMFTSLLVQVQWTHMCEVFKILRRKSRTCFINNIYCQQVFGGSI